MKFLSFASEVNGCWGMLSAKKVGKNICINYSFF